MSALGSKILAKYGISEAAILDTADLSFETFRVIDAVGYTPKRGDWHWSINSLAYLADGSIAAIITENSYVDKESFEEDWLCILRPDGGTEQYLIGEDRNSSGYRIVSNDPDYVIVEPFNLGRTIPRLVNRMTGEVVALQVQGSKLASVPLADITGVRGIEGMFTVIDVLNDGRTMIVRDGHTGTIGLFRPDSMETKIARGDDYTAFCMNFTGDPRDDCAQHTCRANTAASAAFC